MIMKFWRLRRTSLVILCCLTVLIAGCSKKQLLKAEEVTGESKMDRVATDKAAYKPGEQVNFTLYLKENVSDAEVRVQYRHLEEVIEQQELKAAGEKLNWTWNPPKEDGKGYMAEIFLMKKGEAQDHLNIAVDVSSDWTKFPRYGYLADFHAMSQDEMASIIERLNRFHINGVQFYDWQYKHQTPIKMDADQPAKSWDDIANRPVAFDTVKGYIDLVHGYNMKAMNYNLIFGAYEDAEQDGVKREWGLFKDPSAMNQDKHPLPENWASDIMLYDPSNTDWQKYLIEKEAEVFKHLPFDGWHVDQLGDRGGLWNAQGESVKLPEGYVSFLKSAKERLDIYYVMNAVGQYGQAFMAPNAPLDFLYTEVWDGHPKYKNLKEIIDQNAKYSKNQLNTVLAAYMNYDLANTPGEFNTPGVLLTDAVIFASGGSHLELGENMLAKEYFPNKNLKIPAELEEQLIHYYDFLVAYQNILRDGMEESEVTVEGTDEVQISASADQGKVWSFAKHKDGEDIVHFINFTDAVTMDWNDSAGEQTEPAERQNVKVIVQTSGTVDRIMFASPDYYGGSPVELSFEQKDGQISIELPKLKYWDLIKISYK
ncbi:glycoside hydrolase family 66 protein [Paenibacillus ihumii]|uniref:glycoside hydrolase family 66 protein n=1 Tax=Paenibacillus ihumii TaxID=687436 RepID=UPI0006D7C850|nr:glycoside hydrolase family 66 protein [Paenibacillus ihumii]